MKHSFSLTCMLLLASAVPDAAKSSPPAAPLGVSWRLDLDVGRPMEPAALCETALGFALCGYRTGSLESGEDIYVVHLDADGRTGWEFTLENPGQDRLLGLSATADAGLVTAGWFTPKDKSSRHPMLMRLGPDSQVVWIKVIDEETPGGLEDALEAKEGSLIAVGYTGEFADPMPPTLLLVKMAASGEVVWSKTPAPDALQGSRIREVAGGYLIAGRALAGSSSKLYVGRTDLEGNLQFEKKLSYAGQLYNDATDIVVTDSGYVVTGSTIPFVDGTSQSYALALTADGVIQWKTYMVSPTCQETRRFTALRSGGYLVPGCSGSGARITRLDSSGNQGAHLEIQGLCAASAAIESRDGDLIIAARCGHPNQEAIVIFRVTGERPFRRGEVNLDGVIDISDAISILLWLFGPGGMPPCPDALDANDDAKVDISDAISLLSFQFIGTPAPPEPFASKGMDPTPDLLGCREDLVGP